MLALVSIRITVRFPPVGGASGIGQGIALALAAVPAVAQAHFKMLEPASWIVEDQRGDPQKAGPCGGTNTDNGTPSNIVNKAAGGQKIHVKDAQDAGASSFEDEGHHILADCLTRMRVLH